MPSVPSTPSRLTRRQFAQKALASAAVLSAPAFLRGQNLNSKLNVAIIGSGGRGGASIKGLATENLVLFCDVDEKRNDAAAANHPKARKLVDFRQAFDHAAEFDAVVVSTCEHTHAIATMLALKHKKHVYCEKPLTHNVYEARKIREAAAAAGVVTQMGIQMHATENYRRVVELVQGGAIGPVHEAHVWVSRAWGLQSKEASDANKDRVFVTERPAGMPVPAGLNWDLWLGPAPERPFNEVYVPGPKWYRWWDFGNGTMSDLGSHWNDLPFWALQLKAPLTIEAFGPKAHPEIAPATMRAIYEFGARGSLPPVKLTWHQGQDKPAIWTEKGIPQWDNGVLFIGSKGMLLSDYSKHVLLPEKSFADFVRPAPTIPKAVSHWQEWVSACKGQGKALANFDYSGWLTESNHLGNVAFRVGKKLEWDPVTLRAKNAPAADQFLKRDYRKGWSL
ncbi:Gfo/Idh/MocA family protein [Horticoccus sp. 23ND18S-11]|uniref:Gfo/Idh/MocA family protein n=1 Tax=Horticoccus sp. 23ND18S-11 TaxID=3391832 RepID=UPI0039C92A98